MVTHVLHMSRFLTETSEFVELFEEPKWGFSTSTFLSPNWLDITIAPSSPMLSKYLQVHNNYQVAFEKFYGGTGFSLRESDFVKSYYYVTFSNN